MKIFAYLLPRRPALRRTTRRRLRTLLPAPRSCPVCLSLVPRVLIARAPRAYRSCPARLSLVPRVLIARAPRAYRSCPACLSLVPFNFQLSPFTFHLSTLSTHKSPPTMPDEAVLLLFTPRQIIQNPEFCFCSIVSFKSLANICENNLAPSSHKWLLSLKYSAWS